MGSPIALCTGVAIEPLAGPLPAPTDLGDVAPFDVTLGVAIASAMPALPAMPAAAPPMAEPLLDLMLDGEWLPDEPAQNEESGEVATGAVVDGRVGHPARTTSAGEPMVLEKNLDSWLAAFGRREREVRSIDDPNADPNLVQLDEPAPAPGLDRLTTVVPSIGVGPPGQTDATVSRDLPLRTRSDGSWAGRRMLDNEDGLPDGLIDAETLLRTRRGYEPAVEVGGFGFPLLPDAPETPDRAGLRPVLLPPDLPGADSTPGAAVPLGRALQGARFEAPTTGPDLLSVSQLAGPPDPRLAEILATRTLEGAKRPASPLTEPGAEVVGRLATLSHSGGQSAAGQSRSDAPPRDESRSRREPSAILGDGPVRRRAASESLGGDAPTPPGPVAAAPEPARSERPKAVDGPVALAQPNLLDRMARRIDHLTLDLKDEAGDYGRLRVSVSGPLVRATIMPNDPAMADRLNLEIRQLKTSLEERGFPEPKLTVLAPRATEPAAWVSVGREVVSDPAPSPQANTDRRTSDDERRDRWAANRDQRRDGQRHQEHPRQPRRDHHGEPK